MVLFEQPRTKVASTLDIPSSVVRRDQVEVRSVTDVTLQVRRGADPSLE